MGQIPDDILAEQLRKLAVNTTGKETGSAAVSWVANHMPSNTFRVELPLNVPPPSAVQAALELLDKEGELQQSISPDAEHPTVSALVGSGFLKLNPTLVTVELVPLDPDATMAIIFGTAKEGVIRQRAGEKAAKWIAELLEHKCQA